MKIPLWTNEKYAVFLECNESFHHNSIMSLYFQFENNNILISCDTGTYILSTLEKSLTKLLNKGNETFEMDKNIITSLGEYFNKYSFNLGHLDSYDDEDIVENYSIFNDINSLFFYREINIYFMEISLIYNRNNDLASTEKDLKNWLLNDYKYFKVNLYFEELSSFLDTIKSLRSNKIR